MNRTLIFLCLALVILTVDFVGCRGGGGRGGGGRGGGGRGGGRGGSGRSTGTAGIGGWISRLFGGGTPAGTVSRSHTYPASSGYSGHGIGGSHTYPSSKGFSGTGTGKRYGLTYGQQKYGPYIPSKPTFYTAPQYVYVKQYRQSDSRYNNLLIGLTMYNLGRTNSYYHYHNYHDGYYRRNSDSTSPRSDGAYDSPSSTDETVEDKDNEANCVMEIEEDGGKDVFSIPCAIVTTFAISQSKAPNITADEVTTTCVNSIVDPTANSVTSERSIAEEEETVLCKSTSYAASDPLSVKGGVPLNPVNMKCTVEIRTNTKTIRTIVSCNTLLQYSKMSVPDNKETMIMPPRATLKDMLEHPPWWLSLFFAV